MKTLKPRIVSFMLSSGLLGVGCAEKRAFTTFLTGEISHISGEPSRLPSAEELYGKWSVKRDKFGAAIDTTGISFAQITNILSQVHGEPKYYSPPNERHGSVYVYLSTNPPIIIWVTGTRAGAEVTVVNRRLVR